jgi:hypothetical protein
MADIIPKTDSRMVWQLTVEEFESMLLKAGRAQAPKDDKLLTIEQVCETLNVSEEWIYHHARNCPLSENWVACCDLVITDFNATSRAQNFP